MSLIEVHGLYKSFEGPQGRVAVLRGADAAFEAGTFDVLWGPSGCGKSTLLMTLGALLHPDEGRVVIDGQDLTALPEGARAYQRARLIGFVFQRFHLLPYLTVAENIRTAMLGLGKETEPGRAAELMDRLGLLQRQNHLPGQLSVGEQQRTALARALYHRPRAILADEPTGNLDEINRLAVIEALEEFAAGGGTVVMATHHRELAARARQCWRFTDGTLQLETKP